MDILIQSLMGHADISVHVVGWLFALIGALFTLLYKGIHKRISNVEEAQEATDKTLYTLLGEHAVRHPSAREINVERN